MMTLRQPLTRPEMIPASTAWYLADLGEERGKQELFTRQSPQRLRVLREHALIESAVSSNRIEGVEIDESRVGTIVFRKPILRDRNEEEARGYREALRFTHEDAPRLPRCYKDMIRQVLRGLQKTGRVGCLGRGPYAAWRKRGNALKRGNKEGNVIPKDCKRYAEVDFAIVKVSKRSAREKSIRHGRPSRLHLWWARRSLAACRAMLMVLLLPEPCDEHCPGPFIDEAHSTVLSYHGWPVKREKPVADNKVSYCLKHFEAWNHDKCHIHYRV